MNFREKLQDLTIISNFAIFIMLLFICYKLATWPHVYYNDNSTDAVGVFANENYENTEIIKEEPELIEEAIPEYRIYISGEVNSPGVYAISADKRIIDLVELAGGFTEEADKDNINLAKYVEEAKHVKIPKIGEEFEDDDSEEEGLEVEKETSAHANENAKPQYAGIVNINTAGLNQLTSLPGIGPVIGQNIIDYRNSNGGFKSIDEIKKVSRIGDSIFNQIKDKIAVE